MAFNISPSHCCILVLACLICSLSSQALEGKARDKAWHVFDITILLPKTCSTPKEQNSNRMTVIHRKSKATHAEILKRDQDRVDSIYRRINPSEKAVTIPGKEGNPYGTLNYVVTIGMGTPKKNFTTVFDTGSDLTWLQCKPCQTCSNQAEALFDPKLSRTFSNISCSSKDCTQLDSYYCSDDVCQYEVTYGDSSQTDGAFVRDTLTLTPTDIVPNFMFGCGTSVVGFNDKTNGLIGLGRDRVSLVSQASSKYGASFSYCLPSSPCYTGYLSIGNASVSGAVFTPMIKNPDDTFYYVNLTGIMVGGHLLNISPTVFSGGTILDSGTVVTRLPETAYVKLRNQFVQLMKKYPQARATSILDTCFDFTRYRIVKVPAISFVFSDRTTADIDFAGIFYVYRRSRVCLAFAGNGNPSSQGIIGNIQQKKLDIVYDIAKKRIGFGSGGCN